MKTGRKRGSKKAYDGDASAAQEKQPGKFGGRFGRRS